jgi:predicted permease
VTRLRVLLARLRGFGRTRQQEQDLRAQIDAHIEEAVEEYLQQGLPPAEARRLARRDFGGVAQVEEACRDARGPWLRDLSRDVRYSARTLRRNPAFAAIAIVSLAVGIGANTAIFSLVNSLLFRPRAVADPSRIVELYTGTRSEPYETTSYPSYLEFRDRNEVFTGLAAYGTRQFNLGDANQVEQIWGEVVSGNYFDVLGVQPAIGRGFLADEDRIPGRNPVVVIGHALWQRRFNADPGLVGRPIVLNGQQLTVVGIAPPPYTGMFRGLSSEVWVPAMIMPVLEPARGTTMVASGGSRWLAMIGRLKPDVTIERVKARFDVMSREMQAAHPEEWRSMRVETGAVRELFVSVVTEAEGRIPPEMHGGAYAVAALLFVIVNLVLAIACMNLAGMLLARAVVRRKEIAIRLSLGASRFRIIRQLITESLLLSTTAGVAGFVLTVWLLGLLVAFIPPLPEGIRPALDLRVDWRVLVFAVGFSTLTGVLFGLAPALQSSRTDVSTVLKIDAMAFSGAYRRSRSRKVLVVGQVAFSLLLLIAAGLILRSLDKVRPTRLGFSSENVLVASLNLDVTRYHRARSQEFYRQVAERVAALPSVQSVSLVNGMPGGFLGRARQSTEIEGYTPAPGENLQIDVNFVGPHYFTNMKVPIVQGRDFDERDREGAPCVTIVNEAFVRRYFDGVALGRHLIKDQGAPVGRQRCEVVGVVRDDQFQSLQKEARPFHALTLDQSYRRRMMMLVSTAGDPASLSSAVRSAILALDPHMPVNDVTTLRDHFSALAYPFRLLGVVMGACGFMSLLLATVGIYGVVSYSVAQRTREVGIRMALGALKSDILKRVVGEGMAVVTWGLALGLVLSVVLTRLLTSSLFPIERLFGVSATDALTFAAVTALLALVALAACYVPALRAARVQPIEALRYE